MKLLSDHVTYKEATKSITAQRYGLPNDPNKDQLQRMVDLCNHIFEPLREGLGEHPIFIASFFRSSELNDIIRGTQNSQHMANKGAAFDLDNDSKCAPTNKQIFEFIRDHLSFDQLINEFPDQLGNPSWVHVSYNGTQNRNQILIAKKVGRQTKYIPYE